MEYYDRTLYLVLRIGRASVPPTTPKRKRTAPNKKKARDDDSATEDETLYAEMEIVVPAQVVHDSDSEVDSEAERTQRKKARRARLTREVERLLEGQRNMRDPKRVIRMKEEAGIFDPIFVRNATSENGRALRNTPERRRIRALSLPAWRKRAWADTPRVKREPKDSQKKRSQSAPPSPFVSRYPLKYGLN